MGESNSHPTFPRRIVLAILLCQLTTVLAVPNATVSAQAPAGQKRPAAAKAQAKPAAQPDASSHGSPNSFILTHRQSVIQCMQLAREAMSRNDYLAALPLMERMLSEPNSFVPASDSNELSAHEEVHRMMRQMPADLRQRLEEQRLAAARRLWDQARTGGVAEVSEFIEQFGDLSLGAEAWWWLGCQERDHGKYRLSAAAFDRLAAHRHASPQQRAMAQVARFEMLNLAQQPNEAAKVRELLSGMPADLGITVAGVTLSLQKWLAEHPTPTPSENGSKDGGGQAADVPSIVSDRLQRPILMPVWKHDFTSPLATRLNTREQTQREQGMRPIPLLTPLIVGDQVIVRTLDAIQSFSSSGGNRQWKVPNVEYDKVTQARLLETDAYKQAAIEWAQRRTQADSIFSRMTTNGRSLFAIQEPDRMPEFRVDRNLPRDAMRTGPHFNRLCSYALKTGELEWQIGGPVMGTPQAKLHAVSEPKGEIPKPATGTSDTFGGCFFFGSPLILDDVMYCIVQRETQVMLMALDPDRGTLVWSLNLGTAPLPIAEDFRRSRVACPIVWHDGSLFCLTGGGALVAVDPLLRTLKWGYRYPATTVSFRDLLPNPVHADVRVEHEPWKDLWREPFSAVARLNPDAEHHDGPNTAAAAANGSVLIFALPESDLLHAIRLPDGEPLWRLPRSGGLMVAGITEDLVIVIEGDFVRAHELNNGQQRWRTMTGEVSGAGTFVGEVLMLPAQSGGTFLLQTATGKLLSDTSNVDTGLGSLTRAGSSWIACSRQSLMRLPRLVDVRQDVVQQLGTEPDNESLRVRAAFLDLQAGDSEAARARLEGLKSSAARELRREALIDALREQDPGRTDAVRSELSRQLKDLSEDVNFKFAAGAAIGKSALAVSDLTAAVEAALDGLTADLDQSESLVKSSSAAVRRDRVLLGLIDEAYRRATPSDLPALDEIFDSRLTEARKSRDRLAVQRLAQQWQGLDWSRRLVVQDEERVFRKKRAVESDKSSIEIELRLLDAAGSNDATIALQALDRLSQRYDRMTATQDAQEIRRRILRELPEAKFVDGTTESERIARDARLRESVFAAPKPIFPSSEPQLQRLDDRNFPTFAIVPVHSEPGSLSERLDVLIDRNGTEVTFRGESFFQIGQEDRDERKLLVPTTLSPIRGASGHLLRQGWGIGRIVILLVGNQLFAVTPQNDKGDPNPRFLWSSTIELNSPASDVWMAEGRTRDGESQRVVVDQSNRPVGRIGPVRAGYFCYQKGAKLIAAETETGRELWEWLDLPADVTVLGDDHLVFLWHEDGPVEILSAIDGRKIEEWTLPGRASGLVHHRGSLAWTTTVNEVARVDLYDLRSRQQIWTRTDPKNSKVAVLDDETLAIVRPDGELHLLAARTGQALCAPLSVKADRWMKIVCWKDAQRWYLALTGETANLSKVKSVQLNESYRLPFFQGMLYAVDRNDPKVVWQRELKNEAIALDQSQVAPVMVELWKLLPKNDQVPMEAFIRLIDKRTGKTIYEKQQQDLQPHFLLNPDPRQGIVDLKLSHETIRLTYPTE